MSQGRGMEQLRAQDLKDENRQLKAQLKQLFAQAHENEQKHVQMLEVENRLIAAAGLQDLLEVSLCELKDEKNLNAVGLAVIDEDTEIRRHVDEEYPEAPETLFLLSPAEASHAKLGRFYVGHYDEQLHGGWFDGDHELRSVALVPLVRGERLLGRLHLGTNDPARYTRDVGTYFLERLAAVTAICIENAVNIQRLRQYGVTDTLTGIKNRRYFDQRLTEEVQRAQRELEPLTCLFVDIDRFKRINDNLGHPAGDQVIAEVARRIASHLRQFDVLARYGGEEFVVLLPRMESAPALEIAQRIRLTIQQDPVCLKEGGDLEVTVSIGLACINPRAASDAARLGEHLLKRADDALLEAKESGRNRVITADCTTV